MTLSRVFLRLYFLSAMGCLFFCFSTTGLLASDQQVNPAQPALLPLPQSVQWQKKAILMHDVRLNLSGVRGDKLRRDRLVRELELLFKRNKLNHKADAVQQILLKLGEVKVPAQWAGQEKEAYTLESNQGGVMITANTVIGLYYGVQTLRQLMVHQNGQTSVAACSIHDYPAFKVRGFMHDVGRNFQSVDQLKMQIDTFAHYKINTFHFHLTEYHGWRLESKKYPELQSLKTFTRKPGKFYTQKEFKQLVDFCWARGITVIPEFDTPGHSDAFRKAFGLKNMKDPKAKELLIDLFDELCSLVPKEKMPYIHIGTDEASKAVERVNADYLPAIHKVIHRNNRDVIGWVHGMHIKGDTKQIQQTWASSKPLKGLRHIDSRSNYLNYLQALNFATRMHFQQPCRVPHGDDTNLGAILCYWPDTKVDDEKQALLNAPVMSAVVAYSESVWKGVAKDSPEYWCKIPARGSEAFTSYVDFEERLLEQRDRFMSGMPFLAVRTHQMNWRLLGPWPDGHFPELEKGVVKDRYTVSGKDYLWSEPVQGGTINIRHFFSFKSHIASHPKGRDIVWAQTYIHSDKDQTIDAWIGFNTIAASGYKGGEKLRPQGQWDNNKACNIWVNGERIAPPEWLSEKAGMEHALTNEIYSARPPSQITLKKGWNSVLVKTAKTYKWVFSFSPIHVEDNGDIREVDGLVFSTTPSM